MERKTKMEKLKRLINIVLLNHQLKITKNRLNKREIKIEELENITESLLEEANKHRNNNITLEQKILLQAARITELKGELKENEEINSNHNNNISNFKPN